MVMREQLTQPMDETTHLLTRAARIELLLLDVDGVLTDGGLYYTEDGQEIKRFHVRDGAGMKLWRQAGKRIAIISGRQSQAVEKRAAELGISPVYLGQVNKRHALTNLLQEVGLRPEQICVMGDDLPDLALFSLVGLSVAVADACPEVRKTADYITTAGGGQGAVREAIEWLLRLQNRWEQALRDYAIVPQAC